jgi:hypothetical protein
MVLSYAILADDSLQIDPNQFLAGRRNIKTYKAIPHKTEPEQFGTELQSNYGSGPELTRLAGRGNGGNMLEFSKETVDEILKNGISNNPTYLEFVCCKPYLQYLCSKPKFKSFGWKSTCLKTAIRQCNHYSAQRIR